jgi:predicted ABC-type ATPase
MSDPSAFMFVFAGNNGSGKSTIRNLTRTSEDVSGERSH